MKVSRLFRAAALGMIMSLICAPSAGACTLWAAVGDAAQGGGAVVAKTRDWPPGTKQAMRLFCPANGYKHFALIVDIPGAFQKPARKSTSGGINEKGLVVISATAGSIPEKERRKMPYTKGVNGSILTRCASVDEALARIQSIVGPRFLLLADAGKVAVVEIGTNGRSTVTVKNSGTISHTNHYLASSMKDENRVMPESSVVREARMEELLHGWRTPFTLKHFIALSQDQNAGPDNSIFRTGSSSRKARTQAVLAFRLSPGGESELYTRLITPGEPDTVTTYTAASLFEAEASNTPRDNK